MQLTLRARTVLTLVIMVLVPALFAGCSPVSKDSGASQGTVYQGGGAAPVPNQAQPEAQPEAPVGDTERMIVRTKTVRIQVASTTEAVDEIRTLANSHSGTVESMQVATDTDDWVYRYDKQGYPAGDGAALRGWVTIRVPVADLDAFTEAVSKLGTVLFQAETSDDVTQQHVDMSARLQNLRAQEARLRELVASANNVEEMLAVERELWRVRGEIESLDAQLQYLERQAAMATVTIELTENRPVVRPSGQSWGFVQAITDGFRGAAGVLTFLITFLIAITPLVLIGWLVFILVRRSVRGRRAKQAMTHTKPQD